VITIIISDSGRKRDKEAIGRCIQKLKKKSYLSRNSVRTLSTGTHKNAALQNQNVNDLDLLKILYELLRTKKVFVFWLNGVMSQKIELFVAAAMTTSTSEEQMRKILYTVS
jgi:hypothetical protein